jgi:lysophospholipase L1-like esterase
VAAVVLAVAALALAGCGGGGSEDADAASADDTAGETTTAPPETAAPTTAPPTTAPPTSVPTTVPPTTAAPTTAPPTTAAPAPVAAGAALCIGDSVMLGAGPEHANTLALCGTVDATVSRQMSEGAAAVAAHAPYPDTVVVHLGSNGTVDPADVDAVARELQGVPRVVLATVQLNGGRSWEGQANAEIAAAAGRYPNVGLADWKAASDGHPEYFGSDGIHLTTGGAQAYAATLAAAAA